MSVNMVWYISLQPGVRVIFKTEKLTELFLFSLLALLHWTSGGPWFQMLNLCSRTPKQKMLQFCV